MEKIQHHGKRADAIVKGMLAHSRKSTGEKIPTDMNALADEYLRLSYHGMRAKDKSFNADFKTEFDPTLPKVKVVPQDIGRVLLNIINNAFQALNNEELRMRNEGFKPLVTVSTKNLGDKIEISVKDNGQGIPEAIKDKIFQPFFTTKPTGQGTGLGLSLSYDIVKAHGGEIFLDSELDKGTTFSVRLPI
ncbi:sensor histidine kinase [Cecembia calidifontis]|uniref:sensor histidine kinase n=1 Tax=Cecembia calidifontis TaxID=1187080 RepID=UPI0030FEC8CD